MIDETITTKQEWYDLNKYKDEVCSFVKKRQVELDVTSTMSNTYDEFYASVYSGTNESDVERYPHAAESFKVYKSAIIESCLQGYSALLEISGNDGNSTLQIPELKQEMTNQFKAVSLLEKLSADIVDDWILKGESVAFIKLREDKEEYRVKETLTDEETGEQLVRFTLKTGVSYKTVDIERVDPLDFYIDAMDYEKDPRGCTKIVRSFISAKELLSSDAYPLLNKQEKDDIITSKSSKNGHPFMFRFGNSTSNQRSRTDRDGIEVLTFYGDYITSDNKILSNIKATVVEGRIANLKYNGVSTNRLIYAAYKVDRTTHRGVSPLASTQPINRLANRAIDMFINNLDDVAHPWVMWQKGTFSAQQMKEARRKKEIEYNALGAKPEFYTPPSVPPQGIDLINVIIEQSKSVLGLNKYMAGDTTGAVRTARESAILSQKANARMRVETDVFSYNFLLRLFHAFYAFNRELALVAGEPLAPIYANPNLNVTISTNASRADKEGELNRLMEMLQLPISQMIFSNLTPQQVTLAVRYLMAKAELTDADNLLELMDEAGQPTEPVPDDDNTGGGQDADKQ